MKTKRKTSPRGTAPQVEFCNSKATFPLFVGGFGSGKTHALVTKAIQSKVKYRRLNVAYYLPTYDLVEHIAFPRFEEALQYHGIKYKLNKSKKYVIVRLGKVKSKIIFRTLDKPERIIGYEVADSFVDELDTLPTKKAEDCWNKIIARNRQKKPDGDSNTVSVGTTPEGFRFVYNRWERDGGPSYHITRAPTESNQRNLPADYIKVLEETYPPELLDAYKNGKFVNLTSGTVYTCFDRVLNHTDEEIQPGEVLHIGMDFNVYKMSAIVHTIRGGLPLALDELGGIVDTPAMIKVLKEKFIGHKIIVYPDASGVAAKTSNASISDISLLMEAFGRDGVNAPAKNPLVRNRVMSMQAMFLNAKGDRRYLVNTNKCPDYTRSLEQQVYGKDGAPDKSNDNDHKPDAGGYFIDYTFPVRAKATVRIR